MKRYFYTLKKCAVALTATAFLAACQTTGAPSDPTSMTTEQRALATYAGENYVQSYAAQWGLVGAAGGALAGCLIGEALGQGCGRGAAVGGVLGAGVGITYGVQAGRETERLADKQLAAEQALVIANQELKNSREANRDAKALLDRQRKELAQLRKSIAAGNATRVQYDKGLADARQTESLIGGSRNKLRHSIEDVKQRIAYERSRGGNTKQLEERYKELQQQEKNLDRQLSAATKEREMMEKQTPTS